MLFKLFLLLALFFDVHLAKKPLKNTPNKRIYHGQPVSIENAPYFVQVYRTVGETVFLCGGSILKPQVVLTAAHCAKGTLPKDFVVLAGSDSVGQGQRYQTKKIIIHEKYDNPKGSHDIALLIINGKFVYSNKVKPVKLIPKKMAIKENQVVRVVGVGEIKNETLPNKLQRVELQVVSDEECKKLVTTVANQSIKWDVSQICFGDAILGKDTCAGDSGGPVTFGEYQIGIVSWGIVCGVAGIPGVYTRISSMLSWIETKLKGYPG